MPTMTNNSTVCNAVEIILTSCHTILLTDFWVLYLALGLMILIALFVVTRP
jgi:hypothetical protein